MNAKRLRTPLLVGAIAAVAATAWATNETYHSSTIAVSEERTYVAIEERPVTVIEERVVTTSVPASESLSPNETVVVREEVVRQEIRQPGITVEERRLSLDESLQLAVMDRLATHPYLSGKIGVVSEDAVVTLTGYTMTSGQKDRAGRAAGGVPGVRQVVNEIRPRIGAITS